MLSWWTKVQWYFFSPLKGVILNLANIISKDLIIDVQEFLGFGDGGWVGRESGGGCRMTWDWLKVSSRDHLISEAGWGQVLGYLAGLMGYQEASQGGAEVDNEPKSAWANSEETVGSDVWGSVVGLNCSAGILRDLWGRRGWHPQLGLDIFNIF
jgi:hypothetical protein